MVFEPGVLFLPTSPRGPNRTHGPNLDMGL